MENEENVVKKPFYKKAWFIVVVVIVVIAIIGGASGAFNSDKDAETGGNVTKLTASPKSNTSDPTAESEKVGPGNKIEGKGWNISLLSAKTYTTVGDGDNEFLKSTADDGKEYLILFFEVENTSDEDDYFNWLNFKAYEDDYSTDLEVLFVDKIDGYEGISGDVAVGKKAKGYVSYEVNKGWKEFEITYDDGVWSSNKVATFTITPDQLG